jgi:hypothetical protein
MSKNASFNPSQLLYNASAQNIYDGVYYVFLLAVNNGSAFWFIYLFNFGLQGDWEVEAFWAELTCREGIVEVAMMYVQFFSHGTLVLQVPTSDLSPKYFSYDYPKSLLVIMC